MIRYYVLPIERSLTPAWRGPKYLRWRFDPDPPGIACPWRMMDYGVIDFAVVCADVDATQHASLAAHADAFAFPEGLDANMAQADVTALTSLLESYWVPASGWLTGSLTYRQVLRTVTAEFLTMQRLSYLAGDPRTWGVTLATQYRNLAAAKQAAIQQTCTDLGYDPSGIRANSTLRQVIKYMADQWGSRPINFGMAVL